MEQSSPTEWRRVEGLLEELVDLPERERQRRLTELSRSDPKAAQLLESVLDETDRLDEPSLERFVPLVSSLIPEEETQSGDRGAHSSDRRVGAYELIELIAHGGMGDVWRAGRSDGHFEQQVALKLMRAGSMTPRGAERFQLERQLLADLQHPHIARLLDGGVADDGRPFFVMEYVDGTGIVEHCEKAGLTIGQRLALFDQVLDAVAWAHSKLVIHRDLKPGNILVSPTEGIKLLDFGIAKILEDGIDAQATATFERVLTPVYAAPEQMLGEEVSTATDVYALGVLLHELLAGARPFGEATTPARMIEERQNEPPLMSAILARLDPAEAQRLARQRGSSPSRLRRQLSGDLDAIVAKALRAAPKHRYGSVEGLRGDLNNYRAGLPVAAAKSTWRYLAVKRWRRHRLAISVVMAVIAALSIGLIAALHQTRVARASEAKAESILNFVTRRLISSADPRLAEGRQLTLHEVVEASARNLGTSFSSQPGVEAEIRRTLGAVQLRLGEMEAADEQLHQARSLLERSGAEAALLGRVELVQAELDLVRARYDDARQSVGRALSMLRPSLGAGHLETLRAQIIEARILNQDGYANSAESILRRTVADMERRHPGAMMDRLDAMVSLASALEAQAKRDEALALLQEVLVAQEAEFGPEHPDVARTLREIAGILNHLNRGAEAEKAARRALEVDLALYGPAHPRALASTRVLARAFDRQGRHQETADLLEERLSLTAEALGDEHDSVINARNHLAIVQNRLGNLDAAESYYRRALAGAEAGLGIAAPDTMMIRRNLSNFLDRRGALEEAAALGEQVKSLAMEAADQASPDPMYLATAAWYLATARSPRIRDLEAALLLSQKAVEASDEEWYYPWVTLSETHYQRGELDQAIEAQRRALSLPDGLHYDGEERYLVKLYLEAGDLGGAEEFLRQHLQRRMASRSEDDPLIGHTLGLLGRALMRQERSDEAMVELQRCLERYEGVLPDDHSWWLSPSSDLGSLLARKGEYEESERLLLQAAGVAEANTSDRWHEERTLLAERLVYLYDAQDRQIEAERWREKHEDLLASQG